VRTPYEAAAIRKKIIVRREIKVGLGEVDVNSIVAFGLVS
jgi:hypothetical protein